MHPADKLKEKNKEITTDGLKIPSETLIDEKSACLNCGQPIEANFCSHCGQKAYTSRFTLKYIFSYDFIHGFYNLHHGFFPTIKKIYTRPGHAVRDYVLGKRAEYLNYFSFLILAITLLHFLHYHSGIHLQDIFYTRINKDFISSYNSLTDRYDKFFAFILIPIYALLSFLIFKRTGQNYAEHLVINIFKFTASLLMISIFYLLALFISDHTILKLLYVFIFLLQIAYEIIFICQYFSTFNYTRKELIYRSLLISSFSILFLVDKWVVIF